MKRHRSDQTLRKYYREFNQRYFGGELSSNVIIRWRTPGDWKREDIVVAKSEMAGTYFNVNRSTVAEEILFAPWMKKKWGLVQMTMLHEMVHVKLQGRDNHGPAFEREMLRLAKIGAFAKTKGGRTRW